MHDPHYAKGAFAPNIIGQRLLERTTLVRMAPRRILNLSPGGAIDRALETLYPQAAITHHYATTLPLPFNNNAFDCIIANCHLHHFALPEVFIECHRVLAHGSYFFWTSLGPDTLKEIAPLGCDRSQCIDMHDMGDMALSAKFREPVLDRQDLAVVYKLRTLLADLRDIGEITGRGGFFSIRKHLKSFPPTFSVSFEILYGLASKAPSPTEHPIAPVHY